VPNGNPAALAASTYARDTMYLRYLTYLVLFLACCAVRSGPARADTTQFTETQVKAAYLFNFAKFVEWPASSFPPVGAPLVIVIIGKVPVGDVYNALNGRSAKGRRVQVRQVTRIEEIGACQILFIANSERGRLREILKSVPALGVLTVSDIRNFSNLGGMIGLVTRGEKVQFEINIGSAGRAGLKLSSQMLKLALAVYE